MLERRILVNLDNKTVGELIDSYEENEQTVTINDGHVFMNKKEGERD